MWGIPVRQSVRGTGVGKLGTDRAQGKEEEEEEGGAPLCRREKRWLIIFLTVSPPLSLCQSVSQSIQPAGPPPPPHHHFLLFFSHPFLSLSFPPFFVLFSSLLLSLSFSFSTSRTPLTKSRTLLPCSCSRSDRFQSFRSELD